MKAVTFIVQAGNLEVKVHGTSFNVSAYEDDEDIVVVLQEGKSRGVRPRNVAHHDSRRQAGIQ